MSSKKGKILIVDDNAGIRQALKILLPLHFEAVEGMKRGAFDFIVKPWNNEKLAATLTSARDKARKTMGRDARSGSGMTESVITGVARPMKKAIDLKELMEKVVGLNKELLAAHGAACTYSTEEPDLMVYADEGQISQILINLIKNALQAGAKHINITGKMGKDDDVILLVAKNGEPIPPAAQEQIFVPFYSTKKDGSGIGLSLARQIMRQHGGTIDLLRSDAN